MSPGDTLSASLTLAHKHWTLAITDNTSGKKARFSTAEIVEAPFNQAEWAQEDPGSENHHVAYPRIAPTVFDRLEVNAAAPSPAVLYSQWMSVNHSNLAPTTLGDDSFTLKRAPAVSPAGAQYLRLSAMSGAASDQFQDERAEWTAKTPYAQIEAASLRFITATQNGLRSLAAAPWTKQLRSLVRANAHMMSVVLESARPPTILTAATFAAWNARLTEALERAAPAGAKLRLALGLPGFGPAYHR